jgi:polysaccharide export outer membrane protein
MNLRNPILIGVLAFLVVFASSPQAGRSGEGYTIGPGDVLLIRVWGDEDLTRSAVVSPEGSFQFPLIGKVNAAGRSVDELRMTITKRLADGYLIDPQVEVVIKEYKSQKVYVLGEVVRPGTYALDSRASLIEIISEAGGLGKDAGDAAEIVRGRKGWTKDKPLRPDHEGVGQIIHVDIRGLLGGTIENESIEIKHGDTIFVPKADVFYIFGEVAQPGKYNWEKELTVLKAVILSGGFTEIASKRRIKIRRKDSEGEYKIRARLDTAVEPGDTIIVPESFF